MAAAKISHYSLPMRSKLRNSEDGMLDAHRSPLRALTTHKGHSANLQAIGRAATALLGESIPTTCHPLVDII